jgi:hypothetical protein
MYRRSARERRVTSGDQPVEFVAVDEPQAEELEGAEFAVAAEPSEQANGQARKASGGVDGVAERLAS